MMIQLIIVPGMHFIHHLRDFVEREAVFKGTLFGGAHLLEAPVERKLKRGSNWLVFL